MSVAVKPKYRTDLSGQMAEAEANYARLMRLMPDFDNADHREFAVSLAAGRSAIFQLTITERCRYTTMLDFAQHCAGEPWTPAPQFSLRVYHDVQMAEVVSFRGHRPRQGRYEYPNANMYVVDEKAQLNKLLGEWLSHCLQHGSVTCAALGCE
jgi:hypothetical protein